MSVYGEHVFPALHDAAIRPLYPYRRRLVPRASGRVIEIGVGSGLNLGLYDAARVAEVVGVEPSRGMLRRAAARAREAAVPVHLVAESAECLPFPDATFDAAVATFVMCTIADPRRATAEIRRVLRPDAPLLVAEHVRASRASTARWQRRLTPLWRIVAVGCHLDRDPVALLGEEGFDATGIEVGPMEAFTAPIFRTLAWGVARRR